MKPIGHPDTFSVDSIGHLDTPPIGHPDTQWPLNPVPQLCLGKRNYARASLTFLKAFNAWACAATNSGEQRLPFGILPSPRRLRRRPAAGILPARSIAPAAPHGCAERSRSNGRGTPREGATRPFASHTRFHSWRDPLRVSARQVPGYASMRNGMHAYACIRTYARFCAKRGPCCTCVHMVAHSCEELDGKMCIVPVRAEARPFQYRPYSRFVLDGILLCEADDGRCGRGGQHA